MSLIKDLIMHLFFPWEDKNKILISEDEYIIRCKNVEPLKKEIANLDEEILEIQSKLKEMLNK